MREKRLYVADAEKARKQPLTGLYAMMDVCSRINLAIRKAWLKDQLDYVEWRQNRGY